MKNYRIVELESKIPLLTVSSFHPFVLISKIDNYNETFEESVEEITSEHIPNENKSTISLYRDNLRNTGNVGERLAEVYLKTIYTPERVKAVWGNEKLGYDIWADNLKYEVKTCTIKSNVFFMSIAELKKAFIYKSSHRLLFIKMVGNEAYGYIFDDIYAEFGINWLDVKSVIGNEESGISITASNYCFELEDEFLEKYEKINLTDFLRSVQDDED